MDPREVYEVLRAIGATQLHHANTVATSCTFLEQGGLLSRGYVESNGLLQTPQSSDEIDKKFEIWDDVFLDHVDIHHRGGVKKGPNLYGPVLFSFPVELLLALPEETLVRVTRTNPVHWQEGQSDADRWYLTKDELSQHLGYGDFDKMLVIRAPTARIEFPEKRVSIALDDPERELAGVSAYAHARDRLLAAAHTGSVEATIAKHNCKFDCSCVAKYKTLWAPRFATWFE